MKTGFCFGKLKNVLLKRVKYYDDLLEDRYLGELIKETGGDINKIKALHGKTKQEIINLPEDI